MSDITLNAFNLGYVRSHFQTGYEKRILSGLERHFDLLSPDGTKFDLCKSEVKIMDKNVNWKSLKAAFDNIVKHAKKESLDDPKVESFYKLLYPGLPHELLNKIMFKAENVPIREEDRIGRWLNTNSYGTSRIRCKNFGGKKLDSESCKGLSKYYARDDLAGRVWQDHTLASCTSHIGVDEYTVLLGKEYAISLYGAGILRDCMTGEEHIKIINPD